MPAQTTLAYFTNFADASAVKNDLENRIYTIAVKSYAAELPDPELNVSSLMVGFVPDLAHGIFGTNGRVAPTQESGAYLTIIVDEAGHENEIKKITDAHGGTIVS
ncbi:MAG TPA: hypothetical protein VFC74_00620 [Oscillospiraceae bacterium]|nr:hypothetical protein [Oscillospiraceae bacterium]